MTTIGGRRDPRPRISASQGAAWGYHASDINLALGGLLRDVAAEEASYQSANH